MWSIWTITFILLWQSSNADDPESLHGPRALDDEIAVIGGGFSAIHMAHLLKSRGFSKVNILVEGDRMGGDDAYSRTHRGTVHEMGKHMLIPTMMSDQLDNFAQNYARGALMEIAAPSVWTTNSLNTVVVSTLVDYLNAKAREGNPGMSEIEIRNLMIQSVDNFKSKVDSLVDLKDTIPGEMTWKKKFELYGSFKDFLVNNGMQHLVPTFTYLFSSAGYGRPEDFSAYYGIMFFKPKVMDALKLRLQSNIGVRGIPGFKVLSNGMEALLETWSRTMNVTRNVRINDIVARRMYHGKHMIDMNVNGVPKNGYYDFIVYASSLKEYIARNRVRDNREYQMFLRPTTKYLIKTLVDSVNVARGTTPVNYYADSFNSKEEYQLAYSIDSYATYKRHSGNLYQTNGFANSDVFEDIVNQRYMSAVYTQMTDDEPNIAEANLKLTRYLQARGGTDIRIIETKVYPFFSKYEDRDLNNGMLNEILKEQGKHGAWYVGPGAYIDNVISMIDYNNLLINKFQIHPAGISV